MRQINPLEKSYFEQKLSGVSDEFGHSDHSEPSVIIGPVSMKECIYEKCTIFQNENSSIEKKYIYLSWRLLNYLKPPLSTQIAESHKILDSELTRLKNNGTYK